MQRSYRDALLASADPIRGRRLLDEMEFGVRRGRRSRRRISARFVPPGQSYEQWLAAHGYAGVDRQVEIAFGRERG
jgi:hypothetical protein